MAHQSALYTSTLPYKERCKLREDDGYGYSKLYTATQGSPVWSRLVVDAKLRQSASAQIGSFKEGANAIYSLGSNSGFESNTSKPPAIYTHDTFKSGGNTIGQPIEEQHIITARRFKQKYTMDYYSAIRTDAETTSQTMRMLGTYPTDHAHAARTQTFIPHMCPGGYGHYHPDVTTGRYGLRPTLPRQGFGATLTDGRNLK